MEDEEVIREKMEETRTSLTEKLESLEEKVLDTVQETTAAVTETVQSVSDTVQSGVEGVKDFMDMKQHVRNHPWLMLGGAVMCGFFVTNLLGRSKESRRGPPMNGYAQPAPSPPTNGQNPIGGLAPLVSPLLGLLEPELKKLKGLAVGVTLGTLREMITAQVPPHMGAELKEVIDGITAKLGGKPIPSSDWDNLGCPEGCSSTNGSAQQMESLS